MPNTKLSGYWKGVAVSRTTQVVIHMFLEHTNDRVAGKFEFRDPQGRASTGNVNGTVLNGVITITSEDGALAFRGQLTGETNAEQIIHGTMQGKGDSCPTGTVTLFGGQGEVAAAHYTP